MTPEPHDDKLKQWLERHPAKTPSGTDPERYTREVMARVERMARPGPRAAGLPAPRLPWQAGLPQWWGAAAALAACAAVAFALVARSPDRLAVAVERDTIILSELGEEEPILPADPAEVAAELQFTERLLLAEAIPVEDDEVWVQETLDLLGEVEEEPLDQPEGSGLGDYYELLEEELQRLDEDELGSA